MVEVVKSATFERWLRRLKGGVPPRGYKPGSTGSPREPRDVRPVGGGVSELRIDYGPGYRVYYLPGDDPAFIAHALGVIDRSGNVSGSG